MNAKKLICNSCGHEFSPHNLYYCKQCGGILSVIFEYNAEIKNQSYLSNPKDLLPIVPETYIYNEQGDGLVGYTNDGEYTLECIVNSGGWAISCTDEETLTTQKIVAQKEGIFVEPVSATAVAAISKIAKEKKTRT